MGDAGRRERVLAERGAVLAIVGCTFLYLAFLAEARYRGASEPAHLVSGFFILYAAWNLLGGLLGFLGRPESTRMAGVAYLAGGLLFAGGAARSLAELPTLWASLVVGVAVPATALAEVYGAALARGALLPAEEDPLARRVVRRLESLLSGDGRRKA